MHTVWPLTWLLLNSKQQGGGVEISPLFKNMDKKIFDVNPELGIKRTWHYNDETDEATIQTQQDVTAIIEENKNEFNQVDERHRWGEFSRVASIPLSLFYQLKNEGKLEDQAYMKRWLNDPENRHFRTRPGEV